MRKYLFMSLGLLVNDSFKLRLSESHHKIHKLQVENKYNII